ncbi:alcohol dehydrogenase [Purpureocillium lilacinum]|uniref:Alcohol dehydrogenase n=2 Tax=Purpureocillium lilacinum TaxID=33203 RepID=A0A179HDU4_PURLI|nr:glucose-methanol-choline (gmc) oxidoreductase [Purpureocillium lilacinum]PWI71866.1 alcohol dehydrogenase [Purpureocillium lilacinum]
MTTHQEGREYDIIFAGGGTAACIAAGRLAKADPNLSILLVEGGRNNHNDPTVVSPAIYLSHLAPGSQTALFYQANKEKALNDREAIVPSGGMLGGGSSINFMMYTRAQGIDYDSWKTEGWDAKSLIPLAKKLETYHLDNPSIDKSLHGYDGPVNVSFGTHGPKGPQDDMLAAGEALGIKEVIDQQDFKDANGFSRWARYVGPDGKRQDTAHRYIHPLMQSGEYPNLHLLLESKVSRVLFDGTRATGIEYEPTASSQPATSLSKPASSVVKAKKLVVVSAGALGTPSILERSGIGGAELLKKLDIPVVSEVPGVGEEYQDHHLLLYPYKTSLQPDETLDGILSGRLDFATALSEKNPFLGWNGIDIAGKLRPTEEEVAQLGPDFQELWNRDFKEHQDRPLMLMGVVSSFLGDHKILDEGKDGVSQYATMGAYTAYPYSRGNIHIVSKDAQTPASFNTGFLSHPADLTKQVWAYKKQREIYRRTNAFAGELAIGHPKFREGSKAALSDGPLVQGGFKSVEDRKAIPPIVYDAEDDAAIEDWIRSNLNTTWHSLGTCKMAPKDKGGVVDKSLNVYGTQGLKLADLSIVPENVGANTNNTALIVGEKAAVIIGEELGLDV